MFDPQDYGPVFAPLLDVDRCRRLDAGRGVKRPSEIELVTPEAAFSEARLVNQEMARCCIAGLWLLYDELETSHRISQGIPSPSGSFWHGIMHRREGDFSNAKYWFRRVGEHPVFEELGKRAAESAAAHATGPGADFLKSSRGWDSMAFVDLCESAVRSGGEAEALCRAVQQAEWELLFDYCYRAAVD